jgi:hypothetical protein
MGAQTDFLPLDPEEENLPPTSIGDPNMPAGAMPPGVAPAESTADPLDAGIPSLAEFEALNPYGTGAETPGWTNVPATRDMPASWSRERIILLQRQMQAAGVLVPPYTVGVWDPASSQAYHASIAHANTLGVGVDAALSKLASATVEFPQPAATLQPIKPSDLARNLKALWTQFLGGREPTTDELQEFTAEVMGMRQAAEAGNLDFQGDVQQAAFDASRTGTPEWANMPALEEGEEAGLVTEEDMGARITELFQQRYGSEIAGVKAREETAESQAAGAGLFQTDWGQGS